MPADHTRPSGSSAATEWYWRWRGLSSMDDHCPVAGDHSSGVMTGTPVVSLLDALPPIVSAEPSGSVTAVAVMRGNRMVPDALATGFPDDTSSVYVVFSVPPPIMSEVYGPTIVLVRRSRGCSSVRSANGVSEPGRRSWS
ncbi:hypothetical protein LRS13_05425 [Svornostia abyssi]|uniref:Uncharacterized protein n=1 Tax=Svornostia abyssi TaxID=2898438 RepID=A0ABY5PJX9_9ACTN|nr:hypothetical protein LRS13_05425 [Parviterribacteraceae bacterium J379]